MLALFTQNKYTKGCMYDHIVYVFENISLKEGSLTQNIYIQQAF